MKQMIFILFIVDFFLGLSYPPGKEPNYIEQAKTNEINKQQMFYIDLEDLAMKERKIFPFGSIYPLFDTGDIKFKGLEDYLEFIFNRMNPKQREVLWQRMFKLMYRRQFLHICWKKKNFDFTYQKIEKEMYKELKDLSGKKLKYLKLNNIYKKYRDKFIKELFKKNGSFSKSPFLIY